MLLPGETPCELALHPKFDVDGMQDRNGKIPQIELPCANGISIIRIGNGEIRVLFANGGWLRLSSKTPISAFIKPEEQP